MASKSRVLSLAAATLAATCALAQQGSWEWKPASKAWTLLLNSMRHSMDIPVQGIIMRRQSPDSKRMLQLQLEQSGHGRMKLAVLSPLDLQGIVSIDYGRQWMTYNPDDKEFTIQ